MNTSSTPPSAYLHSSPSVYTKYGLLPCFSPCMSTWDKLGPFPPISARSHAATRKIALNVSGSVRGGRFCRLAGEETKYKSQSNSREVTP